nr:MAG TPA: hypothetical protein [Bacteriophage sp.]
MYIDFLRFPCYIPYIRFFLIHDIPCFCRESSRSGWALS